MIARGDIRWFRSSSRDEQRPVLVVARADLLPSFAQIPVIPLSTQARGLRWEIALTEKDGVLSPCVLKPEWIRAVERASLGSLIARFDERRWREVRVAVLDVLGFA